MNEDLKILNLIVFVIITFLAFFIIIYVLLAIVLNKINQKMYGKKTPLAWIPICNIYLLGKLTISKTVGWILIIYLFLILNDKANSLGIELIYNFVPEKFSDTFSSFYVIIVLGLIMYSFSKFVRLLRTENDN